MGGWPFGDARVAFPAVSFSPRGTAWRGGAARRGAKGGKAGGWSEQEVRPQLSASLIAVSPPAFEREDSSVRELGLQRAGKGKKREIERE